MAAKHSLDTHASLSRWDLVSSDSPLGMKAQYGTKLGCEIEPNQMKVRNF